MKRLTLFLLFFAALPISLFGQSQNLVTGSITSSGSACQPGATYTNCVIAAIPSGATAPAQSVGVTITGTFSGTLQFEVSLDNGANWSAVNATPPNSTSAVTSTTSTGFWTISAAGGSHVRVRASALASGSATASINPSQAIVPAAGGGVSPGVTSVGLTLNGTSPCGAAAVTGSPVTTSGTLNINFTGTNGDIVTFNGSNCPVDSGTLLSSLAPKASPAFTGTPTGPLGNITQTIASGTSALGTGAITSATCATVVTTTATGAASTDTISWTPNASIKAVTGYAPSTSGGLSIAAYPTTNNVNFDVCNWTTGSITPGAVTLNWRVTR